MCGEACPSVEFFERQFRGQIAAGQFALNPFEQAALPFLRGRVLDLGCGLGNLSLEAARRGFEVVAVDASATAIERIAHAARAERLRIGGVCSNLRGYRVSTEYDTVIAIGLVMFFDCAETRRLLGEIRRGVAAGGVAIVNALIEGTTWLEPFGEGERCLLPEGEVERVFSGWRIAVARREVFAAPGGTQKRFDTVVAERA